jgi:small neutral amino acid transporter SnatA (MarC family)
LVATLGVVLLGLYFVLGQASRIRARLGVIGLNVMVRLTGLILASIAVQFVLDGVLLTFRG